MNAKPVGRITVKYAAAEALRLLKRNLPGDVDRAREILELGKSGKGLSMLTAKPGTQENNVCKGFIKAFGLARHRQAFIRKSGGLYYVGYVGAAFTYLGGYTLADLSRMMGQLFRVYLHNSSHEPIIFPVIYAN